MAQGVPSSAESGATHAARLAARRKDRQERYLQFLRLARSIRLEGQLATEELDAAIRQGEDELEAVLAQIGGRISPRRRPANPASDRMCTVFIDECGDHSIRSKDKFGAFCLAATIIRDTDSRRVDRQWKEWKRRYLGSAHKLVHEPDIRTGSHSFWCNGSSAQRAKAVGSLDRILQRLEFSAVVCVLNRPSYRRDAGTWDPDDALPRHPYVMMTHFLMERLSMVLDGQYGGARAKIIFESRGPREDAMLQHEVAGLFLDGTSYVSPTWFRRQFLPGIEFHGKGANTTGLQLADLVARPCGEKVLAPETVPPRWDVLKKKLCRGRQTRHSILGLKIVPWEERYEDLWDR